MEPPRRSPLSEIHDRERKRRIRRCLRHGQALLEEWRVRRRARRRLGRQALFREPPPFS